MTNLQDKLTKTSILTRSSKMLHLKYSKVRNVKSPIRSTRRATGIDCYVPEFDSAFIEKFKELNKDNFIGMRNTLIEIPSNERCMIPMGVHFNIPEGFFLLVCNKSGLSARTGLDMLGACIDEDYQGEYICSFVNTSNYEVKVCPADKLVQLVLIEAHYNPLEEHPFEELYPLATERARGGFGSTDKI